jgi:hypothetical protein
VGLFGGTYRMVRYASLNLLSDETNRVFWGTAIVDRTDRTRSTGAKFFMSRSELGFHFLSKWFKPPAMLWGGSEVIAPQILRTRSRELSRSSRESPRITTLNMTLVATSEA